MDFEFGSTTESAAFFARRPKFFSAFARLMQLSNASFAPRNPSSRIEDICHRLAITCRRDFLEILFLAVNGHSIGATKLLRGLYERAVTLAYILKYPAKVDRFVEYGAINEYKIVEQARKLFGDEEINASFRENSIETVLENYKKYKCAFLRADGKKVSGSWDKDFASQVRDIGSPFAEYYLSAYLLPTNHVHATLTSVMLPAERQSPQVQGDISLMMAQILFLKAVELHSTLFGLAIDLEIEQCTNEFQEVWLLSPVTGITPDANER